MAGAKQPVAQLKLELTAGSASVPDLGKMLGPHGVPIAAVKRDYDNATAALRGHTVPAVITLFEDRSWNLEVRRPTSASLIRAALNSANGGNGHRRLTRAQLQQIAKRKLPDLNTDNVQMAMRTIPGTARSMGVEIEPEQ